MKENFGEKIQRVARNAESGERAGMQRANENEAMLAKPANDEFPEFPEIAKMTLQQMQERLHAIADEEKTILDWGDITVADRELLAKKDRERKALHRGIDLRTQQIDGVKHAA